MSSTSSAITVFTDFMNLANFFYNFLGIEPYKTSGTNIKKNRFFIVRFILGLFNLCTIVVGECIVISKTYDDSEEFVVAAMTVAYLGFALVGIMKMVTVWLQRPKLTNLIHQLESIFPKSDSVVQQEYRVDFYLQRCRFITKCFVILLGGLVFLYNFFDISQYIVKKWILRIPDVQPTLPYVQIQPWEWRDNWTYYMIYLSQAFAGFTAVAGFTSSDVLILSVVIQVEMHFNYIVRAFENFVPSDENDPHGKEKNLKRLQDLVNYHCKLLGVTNSINEIFGVALIINFMTSACGVCFMGFQLSIGVEPAIRFKSILYLISCTMEIFLICYMSQSLIDVSGSIAGALYNMNWIDIDVKNQKMLVIIAHRAQQPMFLKATAFLEISLVTMTLFMQMSYKFFALLRTMYAE